MADRQSNENFVELLTGHQNRIYTYILSLVGNPVDARDVLQETNLVLWRKADEFQAGTEFAAWAATIAFYQVKAFRSRRGRERLVFDDSVVSQLADSYQHRIDDTADHEIALQQCLQKLTVEDRRAIGQRYADQGSVKKLAVELGRTPVATAAYLMRLRRKLFNCIRQKLSAEGAR